MQVTDLTKIANVDFEALLIAAKAKHKLYDDFTKEFRSRYDLDNPYSIKDFPDMHVELNNARNEWEQWVQRNITSRGLELVNDQMTGEPKEIWVRVA